MREPMDPDLIEALADAVHQGWMAERVAQGFPDHAWGTDRHGQNCWVSKDRHHSDMLPYADLAENIKEYDRATVRAVLNALDTAGLAVVTIEALRRLGTAIGLLNSMLLCGEQHSETSRAVVKEASSYRILSRPITKART